MFAIVNHNGKIIHSEKFETLHLKDEKVEMFIMELALQHSMLRDFDDDLGSVYYNVTARNEKKFISTPLSEKNILLLVTKKQTPYKTILKQLNNLRQKFSIDENKNMIPVKMAPRLKTC